MAAWLALLLGALALLSPLVKPGLASADGYAGIDFGTLYPIGRGEVTYYPFAGLDVVVCPGVGNQRVLVLGAMWGSGVLAEKAKFRDPNTQNIYLKKIHGPLQEGLFETGYGYFYHFSQTSRGYVYGFYLGGGARVMYEYAEATVPQQRGERRLNLSGFGFAFEPGLGYQTEAGFNVHLSYLFFPTGANTDGAITLTIGGLWGF
jgi:hypothetical protein